ncbi:MAG: hydrolase [Xanthobacteraceae bacterium]|nr:hydrolase [Xanthobacteraceae bacterium]
MIQLDPKSTALVLIDLQKGILGYPLVPRTGAQILDIGKALAARFREAGAPVVLVNVRWSDDGGDVPGQNVDAPHQRPEGGYPAGWADLVEGLPRPGDILITKKQWGAFYGTELDLQLRRRGIKTIVLGGVATNFGVESTARQAWEYGYDLVIVEDATASASVELHEMSLKHIMTRIARVAPGAGITFMKV